ncbi:MAG: hypothetical protein WED00_01180 [Aquisalimonadaceae bacterium]
MLDDALMQGVWPNRQTIRHVLRPRSVAWFREAALIPFRGRRGLAGFMNWAIKRHFRDVHGLVTHSGAEQCRKAFPREFASYQRFAVTRNPWDYFVSAYFWRYRKLPEAERPGFETFVHAVYHDLPDHRGAEFRRKLGASFYFYADGSYALTDIIRFEDLETDWARLAGKIGLPDGAPLARAKIRTRRDRPYRALYSDETRPMVAELCAREIAQFDYTF